MDYTLIEHIHDKEGCPTENLITVYGDFGEFLQDYAEVAKATNFALNDVLEGECEYLVVVTYNSA